jgi:hypothetical protein
VTDEQQQDQSLEMRVAALEEKLASLQITEDDLKTYHRVARMLGGVPSRAFEGTTSETLYLYRPDRCDPCGRLSCGRFSGSIIAAEDVFGGF